MYLNESELKELEDELYDEDVAQWERQRDYGTETDD